MRGLTLIELVLVLALLFVILAVFLPFLESIRSSNDLMVAANLALSSFRRAQARAINAENDSAWGVKITEGKIIIFKGSDFINRDQPFDEPLFISPKINISGLQEVIFSKITGKANLTGVLNLAIKNLSQVININEQGVFNN